MSYNQISFAIGKQQAEEVSDYLFEQGALSVTVQSANGEQQFDLATPSEPQWAAQMLAALFPEETATAEVVDRLRNYAAVKELRLSVVEDQDWQRLWLDQFSPLQVSDKLWVCPSWTNPPDPSATNLVIDPGLAFGTGTHPTTHLCLQYLAALDCRGKTIIDYGCGSGILAIAALALGASHGICVDVDEKALETCQQNAKVNGVRGRIETTFADQFCDERSDASADIVMANILVNTLVKLKDRLLGLTKPGGILMLSGILLEQEPKIHEVFGKDIELEKFQKDDWVLIAGRKRYA